MWSKLTRQRKILLGVTAVVFIVSATLITQTYFTMQIYNAAHDICAKVSVGMNKNELSQHAQSNDVPVTFMTQNNEVIQARMGFSSTTKETCGCMITLKEDKVTEVGSTFCQSY